MDCHQQKVVRSRRCDWRQVWTCFLFAALGVAVHASGGVDSEPVVLGDVDFRVIIQPGLEGWIAREGPRFDTTASVVSVKVEGEEFLCGGGLADEFNPRFIPPPGYIEASPGDPFLKVGVGVLISRLEPGYLFDTPYRVKRLALNLRLPMEEGSRQVAFRQCIDSHLGWAYAYTKRYIVDPSARMLTIRYRLENTGTKPLLIEQYNHNWFRYDADGGKANVTMTAPFLLNSEQVNASPGWSMSGYTVTLSRQVAPSYFRLPQRTPAADNQAWFHDHIGGREIAIAGDFQVSRYAIFADAYGFCPEVFCLMQIDPGEAKDWSRSYRFACVRQGRSYSKIP